LRPEQAEILGQEDDVLLRAVVQIEAQACQHPLSCGQLLAFTMRANLEVSFVLG
jgi:hypothetical protein